MGVPVLSDCLNTEHTQLTGKKICTTMYTGITTVVQIQVQFCLHIRLCVVLEDIVVMATNHVWSG